jgi:hypothetical protein
MLSNSVLISSISRRFSLGIRSSSMIIPLSRRSAFVAPKLIPLNPMHHLKLYMISSSSVYSSRLENRYPLPLYIAGQISIQQSKIRYQNRQHSYGTAFAPVLYHECIRNPVKEESISTKSNMRE